MSSKSGIGVWSRNKTFKLIASIEKHPGLWNCTMEYRDRDKKTKVMKEIATSLEVDEAEMNRKWHNLRCQMNAEIRKKKKKLRNGENNVTWQSSWEYFDALLFVVKDQETPSSIEDRPSQQFRVIKRKKLEPVDETEISGNVAFQKREQVSLKRLDEDKSKKRIVTISEKSQIHHTREQQQSSNKSVDDCTVFGEFVATELRQLRSYERRRKLKRVIQKAIIAMGEEEDLEISDMQPSTGCRRCTSFNFVSVDENSNSSENVENSDNYITLANFYDNAGGYK